jgi:hypothetical protein
MIMKKILLGLVMLLTAATMSAQVKLEYVLEGYELAVELEGSHYDPIRYRDIKLEDIIGVDGLFPLIDSNNETYCFYDIEGNMHIALNDMIDSDVSASNYDVIAIAKNVFTTDGKICRLVRAYSAELGNNGEFQAIGLYIIDEGGNTIQKLTFKHSNKVRALFVKVANQYRLLIHESYEDSHNVYVYSCPGNGETSTSVENVSAKVKRNAYPNPATDLVTLPYDANGATSMKIYDMQGKLVERKFLDKSKQELQLNVKDYPSGMYFFEVNGESNSFIVE